MVDSGTLAIRIMLIVAFMAGCHAPVKDATKIAWIRSTGTEREWKRSTVGKRIAVVHFYANWDLSTAREKMSVLESPEMIEFQNRNVERLAFVLIDVTNDEKLFATLASYGSGNVPSTVIVDLATDQTLRCVRMTANPAYLMQLIETALGDGTIDERRTKMQ